MHITMKDARRPMAVLAVALLFFSGTVTAQSAVPSASPSVATGTTPPTDMTLTPDPTPVPIETPPPVATPQPTDPIPETPPPTPVPVTPPPTEPPTPAPVVVTPPPTEPPTLAPVVATPEPTVPVTPAPVVATPAPVVATPAPVVATPDPTVPETEAPSAAPSVTPVADTPVPTVEPTKNDAAPTAKPSQGGPATMLPTTPVTPFNNLVMEMAGVKPLDKDSQQTWTDEYVQWTKDFYDNNKGYGVTFVQTVVEMTNQDPPLSRRLSTRVLQQTDPQPSKLKVTYSQSVYYSTTPGTNIGADEVVLQPFANADRREAFTNRLKTSGDDAFANIIGVSEIEQEPSSGGGGGGLSTGAIVGIAVGGAVAVLGGGALLWHKTRDSDNGGYKSTVDDQPPSSLRLSGNDDVSTLDNKAHLASQYGDQSVATVDYDYSKAYGGGGDNSVVSSVGGTLGSQTQATAAGAGVVDASFSDDASFDAHYQDPNANVKEVSLDVWAPPGKLGVVIDTPDDGAPVVHAIKDSSVIADKLQVGDKLVAVDDENVESMTAIKVSKLISRKSGNATRKLSIVRTEIAE